MFTLWMLLFVVASFSPIPAGLEEGMHFGAAGIFAGLLIGLAVGAVWWFGLLALRRWYLRVRLDGSERWWWLEVEVSILYVLVFASSFASIFLAIHITRVLMACFVPRFPHPAV